MIRILLIEQSREDAGGDSCSTPAFVAHGGDGFIVWFLCMLIGVVGRFLRAKENCCRGGRSAQELVQRGLRNAEQPPHAYGRDFAALCGVVRGVAAQTQQSAGFGNRINEPLGDRLSAVAS